MADTLLDDVGGLLREAADQVVLPLFRKLDDADVSEKAPGEVVTVADQPGRGAALGGAAPAAARARWWSARRASPTTRALLRHLRDGGDVWLVDPVDGTANFAAGRRPFALMVALLTDGRPTAGWILDPLAGTLAAGSADEGTLLNGRPVDGTGTRAAARRAARRGDDQVPAAGDPRPGPRRRAAAR